MEHTKAAQQHVDDQLMKDFQLEQPMENMTFILFGATGDLAKRKLFPALYNLFLDGKLPDSISIIGLGRREFSHETFQTKVEQALQDYSRRAIEKEGLKRFLDKFRYCIFDATKLESYENLLNLIRSREKELSIPDNRLFYLSVAPSLIETITTNLKASGLSQTEGWKRLVIEKPFGTDLESARQLTVLLEKTFHDDEIYRIDHYLGKPMVQNLESIKLANPILDSLWNPKHIANVQITASETVGVEERASYYDKAGAIRDMAQNHLLQLVMMTALHLPDKVTAEVVEASKREIIESLRPIRKEEAAQHVVRGQYGPGAVLGTPVAGYLEEPGVPEGSQNDTYFAARLLIDHPSWKGIPFYIRTGKRLAQKSTRIIIEFKNKLKEVSTIQPGGIAPNLLIIEINPNDSVSVQVNMRNPSTQRFEPIKMTVSTHADQQPEAYELLLFDAMRGNETFFAHWKEVELSWQWIQPLLEAFNENSLPLHRYTAGSDGPEAAAELLQADQFSWW